VVYRKFCMVLNRGSGPEVAPVLTPRKSGRAVHCASNPHCSSISSGQPQLSPRWPKLHSLHADSSATLWAMTTKTIPAYLEDERQKHEDDQLRMVEEAARIQPLHHGHHRTAKQPKLELQSPVKAAVKARKTKATKTKTRKTAAAAQIKSKPKPRAARKPATKARKAA
jgi:hypothetical protein